MNDLLEKLAGSTRKRESSDHLQLLAKRAAGIYTGKDSGTLTDAVKSAVNGEDLNKDQVRRVAEIANQTTWKTLFVDGGDSKTQFEPADASAVLEGLSEHPQKVTEVPSDYLNDPPEKSPDEIDIKDVFEVKDDSEEYPSLNPAAKEEAKLEKAASAEQLARHGADRLLPDLYAVGEEFYNLVKQACLQEDHSIVQVSKAVGSVTESEKFASAVMKTVLDKLISEGVKFDVSNEMRKSAGAVVINTSHPLLVSAVKFEKIAAAYRRSTEAMNRLAAEKEAAERSLKEAARRG